jgi:hypothetical protein
MKNFFNIIVWFIAFGFLPGLGAAALPYVGVSVVLLCFSMIGFLKPYLDAFLTEGGESIVLDSKRDRGVLAGLNIGKSGVNWMEKKVKTLLDLIFQIRPVTAADRGEKIEIKLDRTKNESKS